MAISERGTTRYSGYLVFQEKVVPIAGEMER
jgi:hypothetical protein